MLMRVGASTLKSDGGNYLADFRIKRKHKPLQEHSRRHNRFPHSTEVEHMTTIHTMNSEEIKKIINEADEDVLRKHVRLWAAKHDDFAAFITHALNPPITEINFAGELKRVIVNNTKFTQSRYGERLIVDWTEVLYRLIEPWAKEASALNTGCLLELVEAVASQVSAHVQEDDFMSDHWDSEDHSWQLAEILEWLGELSGLLMLRDDLDENALTSLRKVVEKAKATDISTKYISTPYNDILQIIQTRLEAGEVSCGIFDTMIGNGRGDKAGDWICRKIDFIRGLGFEREAQEYMETKVTYPAVCLKMYDELMAQERWQEAVSLLDKAPNLTKDYRYRPDTPNWIEMKYELLKEHGDRQQQISALSDLFRQQWDEKYYLQLKEMVEPDKWTEFYHELLKCEISAFHIERAVPFLVMENEFDWYFSLIKKNFEYYPTDYRTIIQHAKALRHTHEKELRELIVKSFSAYAASRYAPGMKVKTSRYVYFRDALSSLAGLGFAREQRELVTSFLEEYKSRRTLVNELKIIQLQD